MGQECWATSGTRTMSMARLLNKLLFCLNRQAVGQNTPVLLGHKLNTRYFNGPGYTEVDIDVGSSATAARVVGMVQGAIKALIIDMAVVLQVRVMGPKSYSSDTVILICSATAARVVGMVQGAIKALIIDMGRAAGGRETASEL